MESMLLKGIGVAALIALFFIARAYRRRKARDYVIIKKTELADLLRSARTGTENSHARKVVDDLEQEFRPFSLLNIYRDTDWIAQREEIDAFGEKLTETLSSLTKNRRA